jgi:hypothetical protein
MVDERIRPSDVSYRSGLECAGVVRAHSQKRRVRANVGQVGKGDSTALVPPQRSSSSSVLRRLTIIRTASPLIRPCSMNGTVDELILALVQNCFVREPLGGVIEIAGTMGRIGYNRPDTSNHGSASPTG